jgi:hypothetical protein
MRKILLTLGAIGALVSLPGAASAQAYVGPYVAFHDDADFGVGGFVGIPVTEIHEDLAFWGDFGYFFPDSGHEDRDVDYWELNANATFRFPLETPAFTPWVLAGLNLANGSVGHDLGESGNSSDSDTEIGLNLGGGLNFMGGPVQPFVGVKFELGGGDGAMIFAGVSFLLQVANQ